MLLLTILLIVKQLLFMRFTEIEHNSILVFVVSISLSIFLMTTVYLSKSKGKKFLLGLLYTIYSLILLVDVMYYSHFNTLPSISMVSQIKLLPSVSSSVSSLINLKELIFVIDLPFVYFYLKKDIQDLDFFITKDMKNIIPIVSFLIILASYLYSNAFKVTNSLIYQEPYNYHLYDIILQIDHSSIFGDEEIKLEQIDDLINRKSFKSGNYTNIGKGKNLLVLQVEALQNFVIDLKIDGKEVTPNLNKFIRDNSSLYYDEYYHVTARGNTSDAEFVTNNSLYPSENAPTYSAYEDNTFYGLPWVLRENGYDTIAFHGYNKDFWNRNNAYKNQGFETFVSEEDYDFQEKIILGMRDEDFFYQSVEKLRDFKNVTNRPFYGFLVTLSSHDPFNIDEKYYTLNLSEEYRNTLVGNYLESISYFDYSFGIFIDKLKKEGLYDDTVIAVYGDHFAIPKNEDNDILMEKLLNRPYKEYDVSNIPLIIHVPGENINKTVSKVGSQLDFFPTILNIMGYENKKGIMFGRDLNNFEGNNFVAFQSILEEGSFIDEDVFVSIPKNRIFKEGKAIDKKSNKEINIYEQYRKYKEIQEEVNLSREILEQDILKDLIEKEISNN